MHLMFCLVVTAVMCYYASATTIFSSFTYWPYFNFEHESIASSAWVPFDTNMLVQNVFLHQTWSFPTELRSLDQWQSFVSVSPGGHSQLVLFMSAFTLPPDHLLDEKWVCRCSCSFNQEYRGIFPKLDFHSFPVGKWIFEVNGSRIRVNQIELPSIPSKAVTVFQQSVMFLNSTTNERTLFVISRSSFQSREQESINNEENYFD